MNGSTAVVKFQKQEEMQQAGQNYLSRIEATKISSRESYVQMVELVKEAKSFITAITEFFRPMKQKTHEAHKAVCDQESASLALFRKGETIGKQRMRGWEQIEAERQRKAQEKQMASGQAPTAQNKATTLVENVQFVDNWRGRQVGDLKVICQGVINGTVPMGFLSVNEAEVNKFARATRGNVQVPGFEWYNERIVRVGA